MTTTEAVPAWSGEYSSGRLADLYLPRGSRDPGPRPPVLLWLHGGGWLVGDRGYAPDLQGIADRGFGVVSIDYSLGEEAVFPAQLFEARAAVRWIIAHAAGFDLDGSRIGVWGSSVGGQLAALLGVTGRAAELPGEPPGEDAVAPTVAAVVVGYAPSDLTSTDQDNPRTARLLGGSPAERPEAARAASPALRVPQEPPPFLIVHGENDEIVPVAQSAALFVELRRSGGRAELLRVPGLGHGLFDPDDHELSRPVPGLDFGALLGGRQAVAVRAAEDGSPSADEQPISETAVIEFFEECLR